METMKNNNSKTSVSTAVGLAVVIVAAIIFVVAGYILTKSNENAPKTTQLTINVTDPAAAEKALNESIKTAVTKEENQDDNLYGVMLDQVINNFDDMKVTLNMNLVTPQGNVKLAFDGVAGLGENGNLEMEGTADISMDAPEFSNFQLTLDLKFTEANDLYFKIVDIPASAPAELQALRTIQGQWLKLPNTAFADTVQTGTGYNTTTTIGDAEAEALLSELETNPIFSNSQAIDSVIVNGKELNCMRSSFGADVVGDSSLIDICSYQSGQLPFRIQVKTSDGLSTDSTMELILDKSEENVDVAAPAGAIDVSQLSV